MKIYNNESLKIVQTAGIVWYQRDARAMHKIIPMSSTIFVDRERRDVPTPVSRLQS